MLSRNKKTYDSQHKQDQHSLTSFFYFSMKARHSADMRIKSVPVLIRVSIAAMKLPDQKKTSWGGKGFFWLTFQHCFSSLKEVKYRNSNKAGSWSQDLMQRPWSLLACFPWLAHPTSYRTQDHQSPGIAPPTMDWALPYWQLIEKMTYSWISWWHLLNWGFFLSYYFGLCQVDTLNQPVQSPSVEGKTLLWKLGML